jgi:hypothetical protein
VRSMNNTATPASTGMRQCPPGPPQRQRRSEPTGQDPASPTSGGLRARRGGTHPSQAGGRPTDTARNRRSG